MNVTITPGPLAGTITPPASKSESHRMLIAAALAGGTSRLERLSESEDIAATAACLTTLGARIDGETVHGIAALRRRDELPPRMDCGESGSTLRFLIPVALAVAGGGLFTGHGRLLERPLAPYRALFLDKGILFQQSAGQLRVSGTLYPGEYCLPGNVSSQFLTGLLFALPLLDGPSRLTLTTPLESAGYVEMTLHTLRQFGVRILRAPDGYLIDGKQHYRPQQLTVEGDWSQAAFFWAANGLGSEIQIEGMNVHTAQGDCVIVDYCDRLARPGRVELDVSQCPDLAPALAVRAALRAGEVTRLVGAGRLRMKESDRIDSIAGALGALGARVTTGPDWLELHGVSSLAGGEADSYHDHRIAMMLAVAATRAVTPVVIRGAQCVTKSYPRFWADYAALGGQILMEEETRL